MPTDQEFGDDLNLTASDTTQIIQRLKSSIHFLSKVDTRLTSIDTVLQPTPPPIEPEISAGLSALRDLADSISTTATRIIDRGNTQ